MKIRKIMSNGNAKLDKKVGIFNLPTDTCKQKCYRCYAHREEKIFRNTLEYRYKNYELTRSNKFVSTFNDYIKNNNLNIIRLHSSGDFYSQDYINNISTIVKSNPNTTFYAYTKVKSEFSFKKLEDNTNINIINSMTPSGYNYGDAEYCNSLVRNEGYKLCPCKPGVKVKCMNECNYCSIKGNDKVCFHIH